MLSLSQVHKAARKNRANVGIGCDRRKEIVQKSAKSAEKEGFAEVKIFSDAESLVSALKKEEIQCAVRGTLSAKPVMNLIKSEFEVENLIRIAFMVMDDKRVILIAPAGVDEGQSMEEKVEIIDLGCRLLAKFKAKENVGVLSGGRLEDLGRHMKVDETLMEGEKVTSSALDKGVAAKHYGILIEEAAKSSNLLLAPDGISGNLIFRTLNFFGGARGMGAPIVNINKVFVDTSRAKDDYCNDIALASALCGL